MDLFLGIVFWVVLAFVVLVWIGSRTSGPPPGPPAGRSPTRPAPPPTRPAPPSPRTPPAPPGRARSLEGRDRVDDAFVDGVIIGGAYVWDHQRRLLREREDELRVAREERDALEELALLEGGDLDDLNDVAASDDYAEFDAMAGYGVEPWAVEQYGPDADDDLEDGLGPDAVDLDGVWDEFDELDD